MNRGVRQRRTCSIFDRLGGRNDGGGRNVFAFGSIQVMAGKVDQRLRSLAEPRDDRLKAQGSRATPHSVLETLREPQGERNAPPQIPRGGRHGGRGRNVFAFGSIQVIAGKVDQRLRSLAEPRDDRLKAQGSRATPIPFLRPFESLRANGMPRPRFLVGAGMMGEGGTSPPPAAPK